MKKHSKLRLIGALCNNASPKNDGDKKELLGDPIEIALVHLVNTSGSSVDELKIQYERISEMPFSSETKIMGTLHKILSRYFVAAKGSVEHLLEKCSKIHLGTTIKELSKNEREKILLDSEQMVSNGLRVLAFAYRDEDEINKDDYLNSLVYVAMIGFIWTPALGYQRSCSFL